MKIDKDDIVIFVPTEEKSKPCLLKVTKLKGGNTVLATPADRAAITNTGVAEYPISSLEINLGPKPKFKTKILGVRPWPITRTSHSNLGDIVWFRDSKKEERQKLSSSVDVASKWLSAKKLAIRPLVIEVYPKSGKYAGMYKHVPKEDFDTIELSPESFITAPDLFNEKVDWSYYVIMHELGHGVEFCLFTGRQRTRWLELYSEFHSVSVADNNRLRALGKKLCSHDSALGEFKSGLTDDENNMLVLALSWISVNKGLSAKDISELMESRRTKTLINLWPSKFQLLDTEVETGVTEYSQKSAHELWAECFAFYASGVKLPKRLYKAVDRTLSELSGKQIRTKDE